MPEGHAPETPTVGCLADHGSCPRLHSCLWRRRGLQDGCKLTLLAPGPTPMWQPMKWRCSAVLQGARSVDAASGLQRRGWRGAPLADVRAKRRVTAVLSRRRTTSPALRGWAAAPAQWRARWLLSMQGTLMPCEVRRRAITTYMGCHQGHLQNRVDTPCAPCSAARIHEQQPPAFQANNIKSGQGKQL